MAMGVAELERTFNAEGGLGELPESYHFQITKTACQHQH